MRRASLVCRSRRSAARSARACLAAGMLAVGVHAVVTIAEEITPQTLRLVERDVRGVLPRASVATVGVGGSGSGVIVTPDGYVLTVHHAAPKDDATVTLVLSDGRNVAAKVLGGDKATDTRLLKIIDKGPWPFVAMAETDLELAVGEWVIGLGHAGGLVADRAPQVRVGRVQRAGDDHVSTDCAMGPGDSGGPLLDRSGRVIGIHRSADSRHTDHAPIKAYRSRWAEWTEGAGTVVTRGEAISAFRGAGGRVARSVVRLRVGDRPVALGTIVSGDGLMVSKSSEVRGPATVDTPDGRSVAATVVGRSHAHDVVLLRVDVKGLDVEPVTWPASPSAAPGAFVAIASPAGMAPSGVGVISVGVRPVPDVAMQMGMEFEEVGPGGVRIVRLTPGGVAANSSLRVGDVFTHINGKAISTRDDLFAELSRPGRQKVTIIMQRDGKAAKVGFPLSAPGRHATDEQVNQRRNGFPACLQHDASLAPEDCGGPLIDIDGAIVAINIARHSHSSSLAIPVETVRQIVRELQASAP